MNKNLQEEVESLRKENIQLRKQLDHLISNKDYSSYSIYVEARKKFLGWVSVVVLIISAFGVVSIANIMSSIRTRIEERGTHSIVEDIRDEFILRHQQFIVEETIHTMRPELEARIEEALREEFLAASQRVEQSQSVTSSSAAEDEEQEQVQFLKAIEQSYQEALYKVIAGSSPRLQDLQGELERVKKMTGREFDDIFPDVEITKPGKDQRVYTLTLGGNLSYDRANELRERAVNLGFREDTFVTREK